MARKVDQKELKSPDQFVSFWTQALAGIASRRRLVFGAAIGVLALVLVAWAAFGFLGQRNAKVSAAFARIERIATAPSLPEMGAAPPASDVPQFKTAKERLEAAVKEADAFIAAHGGSKLKDEALLLKGSYLLSLGRAEEAATIYTGLLGAGVDKNLRFLAQEGLAYAHEATGQVDKAIAVFGTLADETQTGAASFYRDRALFNKARLLANKGNAKESEKIFRDILEKAPTTSLREEINNRLAALEGK